MRRHGFTRTRIAAVAVAVAALCVASPDARATVVFELYAQERDDRHAAAIQILLAELEAGGGFVAMPSAVRAKLGAPLPTPAISDPKLTASDLVAHINVGFRAYLDGRFDQAIPQLAAAVEEGHANPALLVASPKYRAAMLDALVGLAVSYHRRNKGDDRARSTQVLHEMIRSFPDRLAALRDDYGPEPDDLYVVAQKALQTRGTGNLVVDVDDPAAAIFVDEGEPQNATFKANVPPGKYRVLVTQPSGAGGRRFDVDVRAGETTRLSVQLAPAMAFTATERWIGFAGVSQDTAIAYARKVLEGSGERGVVFVTVTEWKGAPALKASVHRLDSGALVRARLTLLDGNEERVRALATSLLPNIDPGPLVETLGPRGQEAAPGAQRSSNRTRQIVALGGGVLAAVAGGVAVKYGLDARSASDELARACSVTCPSEVALRLEDTHDRAIRRAIIAGSIGGALAVGATLLVLSSRSGPKRAAVVVVPSAGGFAVSVGRPF
ncbi:MAG: carboxypeptidase regulatory-like domain-containing protein [Deltaproteobacteria bacterium]|nr:carboxypeptidase regulatory-like domain-containing protein [Deltaproteobacteria bacterium]